MHSSARTFDKQFVPVPGILLTTTNRWSLTTRVAAGFLELGCRVAAVCPVNGHPIRKVRGFKDIYRYSAGDALNSLREAIRQFSPDIIVPVCDKSVRHLHQLYAECSEQEEQGSAIRRLIEKSLGPPRSFPTVCSRYELLDLARNAGVRVPETLRIQSENDLSRWADRLPWFLKADGTSCGLGVRRADTVSSSAKILRQLSKISGVALIKRLALYRDRAWAISAWFDAQPGIIAQSVVSGRPANCAVVCWKGQVLAGIAVEVIQTDGPFEPAVLVEVVEGREMLEAAKQIASRLELTGFFGLDFMIEENTGNPYLIEMNPRCTPPCFINLGEGRDLLGAFWAKLTEQEVPKRQAVTQKSKIAYFPTAVLRNAVPPDMSSPAESVYLDVPVGEPELAQELLHPWSDVSLAGKLFYGLRRKLPSRKPLRTEISVYVASQPDGDTAARSFRTQNY